MVLTFFRKLLLVILSSVLVTLLVITANGWTLKSTIANRETVKNWLLVSGVYDNFVDEIVAESSRTAEETPTVGTIDQATLTNAAKAAFTPALLQDSLEAVLDGSYNWLEGSSDDLQFSVDFTDAKELFASELALAVKIKADALPTCPPDQIPPTLDVFTATCLPATVSTRLLANEFESNILDSESLLKNPVINGDTILVNVNDQQLPIDEAYPQVATWYQRALWLPIALTAVSVLVLIGIVLLSDTKRRGLLHASKSLALAAFSTGITAFIASVTPLDTAGIGGGEEAAEGFSERIMIPFLQEVIDSYVFWNIQFTVLFTSLTLSILVYLLLTYHKKQKDVAPAPVPHLEHQVNLPQPKTNTSSDSHNNF